MVCGWWCLGGGGGCRCVGIDVSLGRLMDSRRSLRRLFILILVGLVLTDCLLSWVLRFAYCVLIFARIRMVLLTTTHYLSTGLALQYFCDVSSGFFL